jgi:NAD(P)-dependent dehydrogenase (short-subunit alcohol dehydrogenase family)
MNDTLIMDSVQDRIALVTHGASEQGQAIVLALQQAGARVVSLNETIDGAGPTPSDLVERAIAPFGRLDILVNTHVISPAVPAEAILLSQFKQDIATNLGAVFFWCQAAAQQMQNQYRLYSEPRSLPQSPRGGVIINISSVGGVVALPGQAAFCAAMAGVNAITKVLATEWQPYGIRVVSVGAGLARETAEKQVLQTVLPGGDSSGHHRMPAHTLTVDSELARVVTYLASDAARHINGTTVYVDGGWLADGYWE